MEFRDFWVVEVRNQLKSLKTLPANAFISTLKIPKLLLISSICPLIMIFSLILLILSKASEIDKRELIISKSDLNLFIQTGIIEANTVDLLWSTLIQEAEKEDPSRISLSGFNKSETLLFGVFPILSFIVSVGSLAILLLLFWLLGVIESLKMNFLTISFTAVAAFVAITLSFILYESFGVVIVTWLLMMTGFYLMMIFFETFGILIKRVEEDYAYNKFNSYIAVVSVFVGSVSYYYSLLIGFPLFQVPFFIAIWYLIGNGQNLIQTKIEKNKEIVLPLVFLASSVFMIVYMIFMGQNSFIVFGDFQFVDFRFLGFASCSVAYLICLPYFLYKYYCKNNGIQEEPISALFNKFFSLEITNSWTDITKYSMLNLLGMLLFLLTGFFIRSTPMIVSGYLGTLGSMISIPKNRFSNLFYNLMYLSAILISAILGYINDPTFNQFLVYYPNSFLMSFGSLLIRIVLIIIGMVFCNKFRVSHFSIHTTTDFIFDFVFAYIQTVILIVFSEFEPNFMMSWAYFIFAFISLEPVIKIEPEALVDNVIKAFAMFLYAVRLSSVAYSSWIFGFNSLFIILIGLIYLMNENVVSRSVKIARFVYVYFCFQYACGLNSWFVLVLIVGALRVKVDYLNPSESNMTKGLLLMVFIALLSFFINIRTICDLVPSILGKCSLVHPEGRFLEREALEIFLRYLNGSLG